MSVQRTRHNCHSGPRFPEQLRGDDDAQALSASRSLPSVHDQSQVKEQRLRGKDSANTRSSPSPDGLC